MATDLFQILEGCVAKVSNQGFLFDASAVEGALTSIQLGEVPWDADRVHLESFLHHVDQGSYYSPEERGAARFFLRALENGHVHRVPTLPIASQYTPEIDLLILDPRRSLQQLAEVARARRLGTLKQWEAVQRGMNLHPLDMREYADLSSFIQSVRNADPTLEFPHRSRAQFLADLLSPQGGLVAKTARLRESNYMTQLRRVVSVAEVLPGPPPPKLKVLEDLLTQVSRQVERAAREGNAVRLEKLSVAARNISSAADRMRRSWLHKMLEPFRAPPVDLPRSDPVETAASSPVMNTLLLPLAVMEHVMASAVTGEIGWNETIDETWETLGGTLLVGGTILGTMAGWNALSRTLGDRKLGQLLKEISTKAPPKVRAFLVPVLFLSAFTYIALRQSQNLPIDESSEYRWNFLEEMAVGFGVQLAGTGAAYYGLSRFISGGTQSLSKLKGGGLLAAAAAVGMFSQELVMAWLHKGQRRELQQKYYAEVMGLLDRYSEPLDEMERVALQKQIDRRLATLIALNVLSFSSIEQMLLEGLRQQEFYERMKQLGYSDADALAAARERKSVAPLTKRQSEIVTRWIGMVSKDPWKADLPVVMLPAQHRRILRLWEKDLMAVHYYLRNPIPIGGETDENGEYLPVQFEDWGIAHTMTLARRFIHLQEQFGVVAQGSNEILLAKRVAP